MLCTISLQEIDIRKTAFYIRSSPCYCDHVLQTKNRSISLPTEITLFNEYYVLWVCLLFVTVEVKNTVMNNNLRLCTIHKWRFCIMLSFMIARR